MDDRFVVQDFILPIGHIKKAVQFCDQVEIDQIHRRHRHHFILSLSAFLISPIPISIIDVIIYFHPSFVLLSSHCNVLNDIPTIDDWCLPAVDGSNNYCRDARKRFGFCPQPIFTHNFLNQASFFMQCKCFQLHPSTWCQKKIASFAMGTWKLI